MLAERDQRNVGWQLGDILSIHTSYYSLFSISLPDSVEEPERQASFLGRQRGSSHKHRERGMAKKKKHPNKSSQSFIMSTLHWPFQSATVPAGLLNSLHKVQTFPGFSLTNSYTHARSQSERYLQWESPKGRNGHEGCHEEGDHVVNRGESHTSASPSETITSPFLKEGTKGTK